MTGFKNLGVMRVVQPKVFIFRTKQGPEICDVWVGLPVVVGYPYAAADFKYFKKHLQNFQVHIEQEPVFFFIKMGKLVLVIKKKRRIIIRRLN